MEEETTVLNTGKCTHLYHGGLKKIFQPIMIPLFAMQTNQNANNFAEQSLERQETMQGGVTPVIITKLDNFCHHVKDAKAKLNDFAKDASQCFKRIDAICALIGSI